MNEPLPRRQLGATGLSVTQLGYGTMGLRGPRTWGVRVVDEDHAAVVLSAVLDAGINFLDTSPDYGVAEERIGRVLGHRRDELLLATKCGCVSSPMTNGLELNHVWDRDVIRRNVETSLKRLRTDHIDVLQFHGGRADIARSRRLIDEMVRLREERVIGATGVSTSLPEAEAWLDIPEIDVIQLPYSCLMPVHSDVMQRAKAAGKGIILRGGIAQGGPNAEIQRPALNDVWERAGLERLLPSEMTPEEFLLRATLSHPDCDTTIVGTANLEHLLNNVAAAKRGPLPDERVREIGARVRSVLPAGH